MAVAALVEQPLLASFLGIRKPSHNTDDQVQVSYQSLWNSASHQISICLLSFPYNFLAFFPLFLLPLSSSGVLLMLEFVLRIDFQFLMQLYLRNSFDSYEMIGICSFLNYH